MKLVHVEAIAKFITEHVDGWPCSARTVKRYIARPVDKHPLPVTLRGRKRVIVAIDVERWMREETALQNPPAGQAVAVP